MKWSLIMWGAIAAQSKYTPPAARCLQCQSRQNLSKAKESTRWRAIVPLTFLHASSKKKAGPKPHQTMLSLISTVRMDFKSMPSYHKWLTGCWLGNRPVTVLVWPWEQRKFWTKPSWSHSVWSGNWKGASPWQTWWMVWCPEHVIDFEIQSLFCYRHTGMQKPQEE